MDFIGVSRTIDHAVYTFLNSLAMVLWKLNTVGFGWSIGSYSMQDWLTGRDNEGVWYLLPRLLGADGMFGVPVWQAVFVLALVLAGATRLLRPFIRVQSSDLGRLLLIGVMSYIFIVQGNQMIRNAEDFRSRAGGLMFELMGQSNVSLDLGVTQVGSGLDRLGTPRDLDGRVPIRGWEAVASSYFLAEQAADLHQSTPPREFMREYCLYDPNRPIQDQDDRNSAGCSPRIAWDEWDLISTGVVTSFWGIPLPSVSLDLPIIDEHPESRQLGIRQAQAGVARLALGPIVTLFPMVESNVGLMLTLAAVFIYLSLPIVLMFGFFLQTESMINRLLMQLISIYIRTLILHALVAVFLMILIGVSIQGSLTMYLGLIGVGLVGGWFLIAMATSVTKESLTASLEAMGGIFTGASVAVLGESARRPAQQTFSSAVSVAGTLATGAALFAGGGRSLMTRAGDTWMMGDLAGSATRSVHADRYQMMTARGAPPPALRQYAQGYIPEAQAAHPWSSAMRHSGGLPNPVPATPTLGHELTGLGTGTAAAASTMLGFSQLSYQHQSGSTGNPNQSPDATRRWIGRWYEAQANKRGQLAVQQEGRSLLGEELSQALDPVLRRHTRDQTGSVIEAAQRVKQGGTSLLNQKGEVSALALTQVRGALDPQLKKRFASRQGRQDLETLVATAGQGRREAEPKAFRSAVAQAKPGFGEEAAAQRVPRQLSLDPVAAGAHAAGLNRFSRLSDEAGLSTPQKEKLLNEVQTRGQVSVDLKEELTNHLARREGEKPSALTADDVIAGAQSLPKTLSGPQRISLRQSLDGPGVGQVEEAVPTRPGKGPRPEGVTNAAGAGGGQERNLAAGALGQQLNRQIRSEEETSRRGEGVIQNQSAIQPPSAGGQPASSGVARGQRPPGHVSDGREETTGLVTEQEHSLGAQLNQETNSADSTSDSVEEKQGGGTSPPSPNVAGADSRARSAQSGRVNKTLAGVEETEPGRSGQGQARKMETLVDRLEAGKPASSKEIKISSTFERDEPNDP